MRNAYKMYTEKPDGRRHLGKPRYRGEDNIKLYLKETESEGVVWISGRLFLNMVLNL
jgi:hypothetical protein